ncbi:MAG: caspase family protein [Chitinophagales bacterium]|nr:caspase family protein [Chitinophagales bacterium]
MKRVIHTLFLVCTTGLLFAQQDGKKGADVIGGTAIIPASGNTYALIIGISKYADKQITQLKYADRDAKTFEEFLKSKAGGEVRDSNIRTFYNQEATAINITQKGYRWLMNRAKNPGDRVYIYFSGHGDAASEAEMFLLAHDVIAGDAYNYSAHGALQVFNLKQRIRELSARGVQVILITDACRTKETTHFRCAQLLLSPNKRNGDQFISCPSTRALRKIPVGVMGVVFLYHLIEGLMAQLIRYDNQVTVYIAKYTDEHVRADRKDHNRKASPRSAFCCTEKEENVLALVDSDTKDKLLASKAQKGRSTLPLAQAKGILSITQSNDSSLIRLYNRFRDAIDHGNLFKPEKNNALYFYHQIAENPAASPYLEDLKIDLIALLSDKGQKAIEIYLKGSDSLFTPSYFSDASLNFRHALSLIDTSDEYYSIFKSRQLFLEAKSYTGGNNTEKKPSISMMQALKWILKHTFIKDLPIYIIVFVPTIRRNTII